MFSPRIHPMATEESGGQHQLQSPPRVCFSFAAYAKTVISQLRESGVKVDRGISNEEFSAIESSLSISFPPDLRSILGEGLPISHGFPNWRSSSREHLKALVQNPVSGLLGEVAKGQFWCDSTWGPKPRRNLEAIAMAKRIMETAPPLVPVCHHYYLASLPSLAGNPVFFISGGKIQRYNVDLAEFFQREEFAGETRESTTTAWAETSPRTIEVWTRLADWMTTVAAPPLEDVLKKQERKLREGGWTEREAKEMLFGCVSDGQTSMDALGLESRIRSLGSALLKAGWSEEDVAYSLGDSRVKPKPNRKNEPLADQ